MAAYQWNSAARIKVDANIAGQMCEELSNTVGLTAETLLNANRSEEAPLHDAFEWDDSVAAEEYRKDQARYIIRSLVLVPTEEKATPVRAYFPTGASFYESTEVILRQPDKAEALLTQALKELKEFKRKYNSLVQLAGVIREADALLEAV